MAKVITTELQHSGASGANITLDSSKNVTIGNNLSVTGTIPADKLTGTAAAINGSNITNLPAANLTGTLPAISGANLTGISSPAAGRRLNRNGAMRVNQRGGQSPAHDGTGALAYEGYGADGFLVQWAAVDELDGTIDTVDDGPEGFSKATKWTTGTAESAIDTGEWVSMTTKLDTFDIRDHLKWGTAQAQPLTVSFWVKSSLTGTYTMSLYSVRTSGQRSLSKTYAISSANTWEKKTVTFDADTAGNELHAGSEQLAIMWALASGSQWDSGGSTSAWQDYAHATWLGQNGNDAIITTASATFFLTGVQAEAGSTATDFEHKPFYDELRECQRYYWRVTGATNDMPGWSHHLWHSSASHAHFTCPQPMRAVPSVTQNCTLKVSGDDDTDTWTSGMYIDNAITTASNGGGFHSGTFRKDTTGGTANRPGTTQFTAAGDIEFNAEL